jgi:predicted N-formylglutamate amidohydrolase
MLDPSLLAPGDPPAVELCNETGRARCLLICDHASAAIPAALGDLGLDADQRRRHIAWDIGAADVTRCLARHLGAPAILSGYSRLVIDCNRDLKDPTSIAQESDDVAVPGNRGLSAEARRGRAEACFWPYHRAIGARIRHMRDAGRAPALVSMHSFTPTMQGLERPWHIGVLWNHDDRLAKPLLEALSQDPTICAGDNEPYDGRGGRGYGMVVHGEREGLPHVLLEVRQDLIDTANGAEAWAGRLASILSGMLARGTLFEGLR